MTRLQERIEFLQRPALFAPLNQMQLQRVAEIMAERQADSPDSLLYEYLHIG